MKKYFTLHSFLLVTCISFSQDVIRVQGGGIVTVQDGAELTLFGGITLEEGSGLANNGIIRLKNNSIANNSDWTDLSAGGAMIGMGKIIFNSTHPQYFTGLTEFYRLQMNTAGLTLNNHLQVTNRLELINGKINTGSYYIMLSNNLASSLLNDATNTGYINSWIHGNFRRLITANTDTYDFPVGNETKSNLLQFLNNNISGTAYLTASFGPRPGSDAGINVSESGVAYNAVNNGGVWYLVPDAPATSGNFTLHLYFNGFTGLTDNQFGILQRPDASTNAADWLVPAGSLLEAYNGLGRKLTDGFARRMNISGFSQWGIGMAGSIICENCMTACTYSQGYYGNINGMACYNNSGISMSSSQLMLTGFGTASTHVFGNVANRRFFTLYKTDITSKNIFKMLPGTGNSQPVAVDNISPYDGAYYADPKTWYLVPMQPTGSQKGRINNQLLSQLITLWFNLQTSDQLASVNLSNDTLVTVKQTACGTGIAAGDPEKFGLPHSVVVYLNGGYGYSNDVNGLYQLANDVLGGVITAVSPVDVQQAVAAINMAFDGCRILTGTVAYVAPPAPTSTPVLSKETEAVPTSELHVTVHPNPSYNNFRIEIKSSHPAEKILMLVIDAAGRVLEQRVIESSGEIIRVGDHYRPGVYFVRILQGQDKKELKLIKLPD